MNIEVGDILTLARRKTGHERTAKVVKIHPETKRISAKPEKQGHCLRLNLDGSNTTYALSSVKKREEMLERETTKGLTESKEKNELTFKQIA